MSDETAQSPNPIVRELYEQLGDLLDDGDDAFIEHGPALLQEAAQEPDFFDNIDTEPASTNTYTRTKVIGDPGKHVIRYMEWPPEYALLPHEHHGRPCFELLVDGVLFMSDMDVTQIGNNEYELEVADTETCTPGDTAVVDPRDGSDVHAVYSPVRARSLHVYPDDCYHAFGYVQQDTTPRKDSYTRERFQLREHS